MSSQQKTAIVTGASQGIGAGVVKAFVERGFNVVANSRKVTRSTEVAASDRVALNSSTRMRQWRQLEFPGNPWIPRLHPLSLGCGVI